MKSFIKIAIFLAFTLAILGCQNIQDPHFSGGVDMRFDSVSGDGMIYK